MLGIKSKAVEMINLSAFYLSGKYLSNQKIIQQLKDKHKGKRCFVICNGPSLRPEDLTKIHEHGDVSIGMNMIGRVYKDTPWRVTYLSLRDPISYATPENFRVALGTECKMRFFAAKHYLRWIRFCKDGFFILQNEDRGLLDAPIFDSDFTKQVPSIGTSAYICMELAVYLGCSEIYLLGCDMSYKVNLNRDGSVTYNEAGKDHFYKSEAEFSASCAIKPNPTWEMECAFETAARWSAEHGNIIKNATRGGCLQAFPRVDFDSLF